MHRSQQIALRGEPAGTGEVRAPYGLDPSHAVPARGFDRRLQGSCHGGAAFTPRGYTVQTLTFRRIVIGLLSLLASSGMSLPVVAGMIAPDSTPDKPELHSLEPADLAVLVNVADPLSVAIGAYYAAQRHIPKAN